MASCPGLVCALRAACASGGADNASGTLLLRAMGVARGGECRDGEERRLLQVRCAPALLAVGAHAAAGVRTCTAMAMSH